MGAKRSLCPKQLERVNSQVWVLKALHTSRELWLSLVVLSSFCKSAPVVLPFWSIAPRVSRHLADSQAEIPRLLARSACRTSPAMACAGCGFTMERG